MNPTYIYAKNVDMEVLNETIYKNLARMLNTAAGEGNYFNGSVELQEAGQLYKLTCTLMIYRKPALDPCDTTHSATIVTDIVPVWWEFHCWKGNTELDNDFSWQDFREYLC